MVGLHSFHNEATIIQVEKRASQLTPYELYGFETSLSFEDFVVFIMLVCGFHFTVEEQ